MLNLVDFMSNEIAILVLLVCSTLAGAAGALLRTWSLRRWTLDLDMRVTDLENKVLHEVKARAANERWAGRKDTDSQLLEQLSKANQGRSQPKTLGDWQREKMKG